MGTMRLCYVLLSPTFGMHQYTADLANRVARIGHKVSLVTSTHYPTDRYTPAISVHTPVTSRNPMLLAKRGYEDGIPVVHTLHDLDAHIGTLYGPLLYIWNRSVLYLADHILVHGVCYRQRLIKAGLAAEGVTCTPLLHLFLGHTWLGEVENQAKNVSYEPYVLFFGRLERYKGVAHLLTAWAMMGDGDRHNARLILAGPGKLERLWVGALPSGVEVHNELIGDGEALQLFRRCGLLVLPYSGATQSALIPAAYFFQKPVMASPSGALDEYVEDGRTGWVVEPEHPASLARCLSTVLADPDRLVHMGVAGRAWYDARRDLEEKILWRMYERLAFS
jgi:glycosyltransferase involved in cell wall biosynthesis